ncbi:hypothetical protein [Alteromonas sp. S015]|uniref:hypothetical protein n=1 Tax=Alteromonas sp. S015 TaxID=3117401 RepID=UPI002FE23D05
MSDSSWCDITVKNADELVSFYEVVMGWKKEPIDMGGYNDYVMMKADGTPVGGICHKRGGKCALPKWMDKLLYCRKSRCRVEKSY